MVVKIEVWPGGDGRARKEIFRLEIANISQLAPISDYAVTAREGRRVVAETTVGLHRRADGFLPLVLRSLRSVLQKLDEE